MSCLSVHSTYDDAASHSRRSSSAAVTAPRTLPRLTNQTAWRSLTTATPHHRTQRTAAEGQGSLERGFAELEGGRPPPDDLGPPLISHVVVVPAVVEGWYYYSLYPYLSVCPPCKPGPTSLGASRGPGPDPGCAKQSGLGGSWILGPPRLRGLWAALFALRNEPVAWSGALSLCRFFNLSRLQV